MNTKASLSVVIALVACAASIFSTSALPCDQVAARKTQNMLHDMATWYEKDDKLTFKWASDWDQAAPHERLGLVRAFADSDACLTGRAREISFFRMGKLVAKASPTSGIRPVD